MMLAPVGIDRVDVRHCLDISAGQVPRKAFPSRADAELAFGEIDEFDACLKRKTERTEAAVGIDAVAIEFAGSAGSQNETGH
jgi:hypothetical protein